MAKLMIVDDDLAACDFYRTYFQHKGYEVVCVTSGREALQRVSQERPHVILLDLKMPQMSGLDVLRQLREMQPPELAQTKVVVVTAVHDDAIQRIAGEYGATMFINKPVDLEDLEREVILKALVT